MKVGSFIKNDNAPDWGVGKILEKIGEKKLRIFFEFAGEKTLLDGTAPLVLVPNPSNHPVLSRVKKDSSFDGFRPFWNLENNFLRQFPKGFNDSKYLNTERDYKIEAASLLKALLPKDKFFALLDKRKFDEICDAAMVIVNKTNLIFKNEKMSLNDGLKKGPKQKQLFSETLFFHLFGEVSMEERFNSFAAVLDELDANKWTTSTYFLFLLEPQNYPFIKPKYYKEAAKAYAFDIVYSTRPNWATYERLIEFAKYVGEMLEKHQQLVPRDMVDVQSFIWCSLQE